MATILRLLGLPEAEHDGISFSLSVERHHQLAAYLALRTDWVQRDVLAELFYPERAHGAARSNLRKLLGQLRADEELHAALEEQGTAVRWQVDTDVAQLEAAAAAHENGRIVELYRGRLLDGLDTRAPQPFVDWLSFERKRLRTLWRDAALRLLEEGVERTELAACLVAADPLDEIALRAQLRQLARCGRLGAARRAFEVSSGGSQTRSVPSRRRRRVICSRRWKLKRYLPVKVLEMSKASSVVGRSFELWARCSRNRIVVSSRSSAPVGSASAGSRDRRWRSSRNPWPKLGERPE